MVIEKLESLLERADYPIGKMEIRPFAQDEIQIFATLVSTSVDSQSLERVVDEVSLANPVSQAFWSTSTTD